MYVVTLLVYIYIAKIKLFFAPLAVSVVVGN